MWPQVDEIGVEPLRSIAGCAVVAVSSAGVRKAGVIGSATIDSPFRIASLTKPLTAVAAVLAPQRAGIELDTAVLDLLPGLRDDWIADQSLTMADILSQTSGLAARVTSEDIAALGDDDSVHLEAARLVVRAGSARPPGEAREYYNGNYFLAGAVIACVTGMTYEQAMDALLLRPWGLTATSFTAPRHLTPGVEHAAPVSSAIPYPRGRRPSGGVYSTAADLLAFGERLLGHADFIAQVRTVRTGALDPTRYGIGWAIGASSQMYLNGRLPGYRAALMLVPEHHLVAVVLAADSDALPAAARVLSDVQRDLTGDDIAVEIDSFAA